MERRSKEKKQIKTRAESKKVSPLFSDFRVLSCHCGRQRVRLGKSQPRGEEGGPSRSEALQAGKTEAHRESDLGGAPQRRSRGDCRRREDP